MVEELISLEATNAFEKWMNWIYDEKITDTEIMGDGLREFAEEEMVDDYDEIQYLFNQWCNSNPDYIPKTERNKILSSLF